MDQNSDWEIWPRWERNHPIFLGPNLNPCPHGTSTYINPICQVLNTSQRQNSAQTLAWTGQKNCISHANSYMSTRAVMCLPSGHKTPSQGSCVQRRPQASHSGWGKFCSTQWRTVEGVWSIASSPGSSFDVRIHLDQRRIALDLVASPTHFKSYHSEQSTSITESWHFSPCFPKSWKSCGAHPPRAPSARNTIQIWNQVPLWWGITLKQSCQLAVHNSWRLQIQCASMYCHFLKVPDTRKWPLVRPQSCQLAVGSGWPIIFPTSLGRFFISKLKHGSRRQKYWIIFYVVQER